MTKKSKNSIIWKIEGSNIQTSHLFGTMHVKDAKAFRRLDEMYHLIDESATFATEFNLEEADHNLTAKGMDLPDGQTLEIILGEKKYKKMSKSIKKAFGLHLDFFKTSKPLLVTNVITGKILSDDMQSSLDESLWNYAKENGKITLGVETFQEQMDILENIPLDYQIKQLKEMAKNVSKFRKQILFIAHLFEEEKIAQLYKNVKKSTGSLRKLMLFDRNVKMANRIGKIALENSIFAAVGAGHLGGSKGVLRLLKKDGFKVKALLK